MQLQIFVTLAGILTTVICRDNNKPPKPVPAITNSLVNLGKMEIAFYINGKSDTPLKSEQSRNPLLSFMKLKQNNDLNEPCPCSNLRNIKDSFLINPSEIINKILRSNDLFANKNPAISTQCCDTVEREDTVFFEIFPNLKKTNSVRTNYPQLNFDTLIPNRQASPVKSTAVEIFLYPKRKDLPTFQFPKIFPKKNVIAKDDIQIVGDKTLKNDIKSINSSTSVKKDLTGLSNKEIVTNEVTQKVKEDDITKSNKL